MSKLRLGLCCISEILKEQDISYRSTTLTAFKKMNRSDAEAKLIQIVKHNCFVFSKIVEHCQKIGISHYRIPSGITPLISESTTFSDSIFVDGIFNIVSELLSTVVKNAIQNGITFGSHPDQYVVLGSVLPDGLSNTRVIDNSIREMNFTGRLHDSLGLPRNHSNPINIHVGSSPKIESPESLVSRFNSTVDVLDESARSRLTLENEDKGFFNTTNLHKYFGDRHVLCFDNLHHKINAPDVCGMMWREVYEKTWPADIKPVFHWSEQLQDGRRGSHADYITHFPLDFVGFDGILEVEVKAKDKAILKIIEQFQNGQTN